MKSIRLLIAFGILLLLHIDLRAQEKVRTKADKQFDKAALCYKKGDFVAAEHLLDDLLKDEPRYAEAWLLKADMYNDDKQSADAVAYYRKAVEIDSAVFPPAYYIMANLYFDMEKYDEAKANYYKYLAFNPKIQAEIQRIHDNLLSCDYRSKMIRNPVPFNPVNIGPNVNTTGFEYINAISLDESQLFLTRKGADPRSDESFYRSVSARSATGQLNWSPALELGPPLNTQGNEGAMCVSPDGMSMIITCCSRRDSYGTCDLYASHKVGNTWTEPENLGPDVNSSAWESQPCLATDGRTLYFVSNRRGGHGGSDIYKSTLQDDGYWSKPVNLGDSINTPYDEMAPFIHSDGHTLYFSSRGHQGMGGADLFVSRLAENGVWSTPQNLGYPVNTNKDEINLIITPRGDEAYISAERPSGFGNTDIYRFELPVASRPASVSYIKGKVYDKNTQYPLHASFELIDIKSNKAVVNSTSNPVTGEFVMSLPVDKDYALNVTCKGYLFFSMNFTSKAGTDSINPVQLNVPMQPLEVGEKVVLRNIFFDVDKYELLPDSRAELGKLVLFLSKNNAVHIEIGGHTDNQGSDSHNQALSQNRAKAVYDYLITNGIIAERLNYVGYGKTIPIDGNETPEGRANNRRTEIKVVSK